MTWRVDLTEHARHDLRRVPTTAAARIVHSLERLAATGRGDVKHLQGNKDEYRLRVGDWRTIFTYDAAEGAIRVLRCCRIGR
ncbi:MAG: type II toxin-antitoxin system RelE/ParE family toxin [Chloroflexi bacterium]|nr:type II toxin-antitoxin system RelE/ParE family toxin [Chloroflexota bacterium]